MKQTLIWMGLVLLAVMVGLALAVLATAGVRAQSPVSQAQFQATPGWYPPHPFSGPGMMAGWRSGWSGYAPSGAYTSTQELPYSVFGPGMMGSWRSGRGSGFGPGGLGGMMGGGYRSGCGGNPDNQTPLTFDRAVDAARQYLSAYGNPDLTLTEVMEFSENFYAEVEEKSTGIHAFELLIDHFTGAVYPEPGPNMMWNTKYGHMGGMMGGWGSRQAGPMTVNPGQARDFAQQWLDRYLPGTAVAEQADAFYGYYTIHVFQDGQVLGMLSLNGYTGEVWYHDWHGDFYGMKELEE
jgi:hypothetical protein